MYAMPLFRRVQMLSRAALASHWSMVGAKDRHSLHLIGRDSWLGIRIYARSRGSLSVNDNSLAKDLAPRGIRDPKSWDGGYAIPFLGFLYRG